MQTQKTPIARIGKKRKIEEEKPEESDKTLKKKRKTELKQLDIGRTRGTRTGTRIMEDCSTASKEKSKLDTTEKVEEERTKSKPKEIPSRMKTLAKKTKKQQISPLTSSWPKSRKCFKNLQANKPSKKEFSF